MISVGETRFANSGLISIEGGVSESASAEVQGQRMRMADQRPRFAVLVSGRQVQDSTKYSVAINAKQSGTRPLIEAQSSLRGTMTAEKILRPNSGGQSPSF